MRVYVIYHFSCCPGKIWYQTALFSENSFIKDFWSFVWGSSITKSFLFLQDHLNIPLSEWQTECKLLQWKLLKILEQFCVTPLLNLYWSPVPQQEKFFNQLHQTKVWTVLGETRAMSNTTTTKNLMSKIIQRIFDVEYHDNKNFMSKITTKKILCIRKILCRRSGQRFKANCFRGWQSQEMVGREQVQG